MHWRMRPAPWVMMSSDTWKPCEILLHIDMVTLLVAVETALLQDYF